MVEIGLDLGFCNCHIIITCNNLRILLFFFCILEFFLLFLHEFQNFCYFYVIFQFYVFCQYLRMNAPAFYMNCHWTQIVTDICCVHLNEITILSLVISFVFVCFYNFYNFYMFSNYIIFFFVFICFSNFVIFICFSFNLCVLPMIFTHAYHST